MTSNPHPGAVLLYLPLRPSVDSVDPADDPDPHDPDSDDFWPGGTAA